MILNSRKLLTPRSASCGWNSVVMWQWVFRFEEKLFNTCFYLKMSSLRALYFSEILSYFPQNILSNLLSPILSASQQTPSPLWETTHNSDSTMSKARCDSHHSLRTKAEQWNDDGDSRILHHSHLGLPVSSTANHVTSRVPAPLPHLTQWHGVSV